MAEVYNYNGIESFIAAIEETPRVESNFQSRETFKNQQGPWSEGLGWEKTREIWRNGWPEGLVRMREALGTLEPPVVKDRRRKAVYADQGDDYDKTKVLSGESDTAWRRMTRAVRAAPVPVRITVDVEAHAGDEGLFWRGACAVLLAESLGIAGYPTQIMVTSGAAGMSMWGESYKQHVTVIVKDWEGATYLPTLIATTGHASFLRVGVFAHNVQKMPKQHTGGMGYSIPTDNPGALLAMGFDEPNIRTAFVPRHTMSCGKAKLWISETVAMLESENEC